ncbi:MAG: hypothetical protein VXY06_01685, partial [Bacteroidota bacterium]|nr:hypothetical protein [Bacteroidota bacterium]
MNNKAIVTLLLLVHSVIVYAQHPNQLTRQGNKAYKDSLFIQAEQRYRDALVKNQDAYAASFNLADAIYKQEQYEESTALFRALAEKTD